MTKKFYYHGKFFDDEGEFLDFVDAWPDMPFDIKEFEESMQQRIREIDMTNELRGGTMTNREAYELLGLLTKWTLRYD